MDNISDYIAFLNKRFEYHSRKSVEFRANERSSTLHKGTANKHKEIIGWFEEYLRDPPITRKSINDLFSINPLDLDALDEDVRAELSVSDSDVQDAQILELLEIAGRSLDLNEIIVGCARKYGTKHKRTQLTARIHRLINKNEIMVVGKGEYSLPQSTNTADLADLDDLFEDDVLENNKHPFE